MIVSTGLGDDVASESSSGVGPNFSGVYFTLAAIGAFVFLREVFKKPKRETRVEKLTRSYQIRQKVKPARNKVLSEKEARSIFSDL